MTAQTIPAIGSQTVGQQIGRDLEKTARVMESWLAERLETATDISVHDLSWPQGAGLSNETILLSAQWTRDGRTEDHGLALRFAPSQVQVFLDADLHVQYDVLEALYGDGRVPVPEPLWYEEDPAVLGQSFYVMRRVEGRVPVSFPSYNVEGFLFDATPKERETLWRSAMEAFCRIPRTPVEVVQFLDRPARGASGFDQQFSYWKDYCRWIGAEVAPAVMEAEQWLERHSPGSPSSGLSWGDARLGNMIFGDDFRLLAVIDWEQASLAGSMHDLAWWIYSDELRSTGMGVAPLEGLGSREETLDLWKELTGLPVEDLEWYEVFTRFKFSLMTTRFMSFHKAEQTGSNMNNNRHTRDIAKILGVAQPVDLFLDTD